MNILFVCSHNQSCSLTAEAVFRNHPVIRAKSAGTESTARVKVSEKIVGWADLIFVMERKHRQYLRQKFNAIIKQKQLIVLHFPETYNYMDPELIECLKISLQPFLEPYMVSGYYTSGGFLHPREKYND